MIALDQLRVTFGSVTAVDGLTASLDAPITGVIGPNGAGKTTILNAIAGTVASTGGIVVDGDEVNEMPPFRRALRGIRRTFQTDQVMLGLSVIDNVLVGADAESRVTRKQSRHQADDLLDFVGYSGGHLRSGRALTNIERRKVEIARALMGQPTVLLMDEPGAGLLADEKAELETIIEAIPPRIGAQVVLIEHDIEMVSRVCSGAIVVDYGRLIAAGTPDNVLASREVRAAYLGLVDEAAS